MIYVVLGMHKSGTTLVAEMLHKSGINMVDENNYNSNLSYRNLKGKMERECIVELNHRFLNSKGVNSLDIDISLQELEMAGISLEKEIKDIIEHCQNKYQTWGFKDPRTCLTYPIWRKYLPEHKVIIIYRSPEKVINHYSKYFSFPKNIFQLYKALVKYSMYNGKLITVINDPGTSSLVISYDQLLHDKRVLDRLSEFIGTGVFDARNISNQKKKNQDSMLFWMLNFLTRYKATETFDQLEGLKHEIKT